jgi:hypothetical protein
MQLRQLTEFVWRYVQDGRARATGLTLTKADVMQYIKTALSASMREQYYRGKKMTDGEEYYFYSQILSIQRFPLADPDKRGMRRADMGDVDLYRLPKNMHFTNVYPVGEGCVDGQEIELTQVSPGEENFYLSGDYDNFFSFYVVKGKGINTYHIPSCIKSLDIETTYNGDDIDVSLDQAMDVANIVLGVSLKVKGFPLRIEDNSMSPNVIDFKRKMLSEQQTTI